MKKQIFYLGVFISLLFTACQKDENGNPTSELDQQLEAALISASNGAGKFHFQLPESDEFSKIPQDPRNPLSEAKVKLGQLLYHETGLALNPTRPEGEGTYSCASCHFAKAGFQAGRHQGIGEGGSGIGNQGEGRDIAGTYDAEELDVQPIRSPSALNTAYQEVMLWNGQFGATGLNANTEAYWTSDTPIETNNLGYEGLEIQAIAGLKVHRLEIDESFLTTTGYKEMFDEVFSDWAEEERYTRETAGLAIAAYERTLLANESPFQQWIKGDFQALSEQEKRGAVLFFEQTNCTSCHSGPALSSNAFYALGVNDLYDTPEPSFQTPEEASAHLGRGGFTTKEEDMYKFKVPQLYNLSDSPFYGHGSCFRTLKEVVEYKNLAIPQNENVPTTQLAAEFVPQNLSSDQVDDIVAFLANGLRDPNLERYEPSSLLSGNCFPNNDLLSKDHLDCN